MKKFIKENWKFLLIVLIGGLIGGYCVGIYSYDILSKEVLKEMQKQNVTKEIVAISTMYQYGIIYGVLLAGIGLFLSKKVNLSKKFIINKKAIVTTLIITLLAAFLLFPGDKIIFGPYNNWINEQYMIKPNIYKILAGLLAGGIIEEVMMRLFLMSLIVLIISKIFYNSKKEIPIKVYIIANIITALLFALGHIPSTMSMTTLTPLLIIRCFLFNGGIGLGFGYLYRKYGIGYAMISHGFAHLISDILMLIFI